MNQGWIKLHRSFTEWEWYDNNNTFKFFIHLLLKCNYEKKNWHGEEVNPGELIIGIKDFGKQIGLTHQQTRTVIDRLKSTNEITIKTTNKFTKITVVNWDKYQIEDEKITNKITNEQQTNNKQITTTKEIKKERSKENTYGEFLNVRLSKDEYDKLVLHFGTPSIAGQRIEDLSGYKKSTGKVYKDDYATILNWDRKNKKTGADPLIAEINEIGVHKFVRKYGKDMTNRYIKHLTNQND